MVSRKMFGYYGSKSKIVDKYPSPMFDTIIEPFAGTAQYSLKYWDKNIILIEKYDVIVKIFKWMQKCDEKDILSLPILKYGESTDDYEFPCVEAKWLVGFLITGAPTMPKKKASKWKTVDRPNTQNYKLNYIANNLYKIRHWDIRLGDYRDVENVEATWFIDPPYQVGGKYYKYNSNGIDYDFLRDWCFSRKGECIVCGNTNDTWMDFYPISNMQGNRKHTTECMCHIINGKVEEWWQNKQLFQM